MPKTNTAIFQNGDILQKSKNLARRIKVRRPYGSLSSSEFDLPPPSRDMADTMAALYFNHSSRRTGFSMHLLFGRSTVDIGITRTVSQLIHV